MRASSEMHQLSAGRGRAIFAFGFTCGVLVANNYYVPALIDRIAGELGASSSVSAFMSGGAQVGFCLGLAFLLPLGDMVRTRTIMTGLSILAILSALAMSVARNAELFIVFSLILGACSVGGQILLPRSVALAKPGLEGRTIGLVMLGLLLGTMLSRPIANFLAATTGWRSVFLFSATAMIISCILTWHVTGRDRLTGNQYGYAGMLKSTLRLWRDTPELRRRACYQGVFFASLTAFWMAAPVMLQREFSLDNAQIGLFSFAAVGGIAAAPIAGRLADTSFARHTTRVAMMLVIASYLLSIQAVAFRQLAILFACAFFIDVAVQKNNIVGQRSIYTQNPAESSRINSAYMLTIYLFGAFGSMAGFLLYEQIGWPALSVFVSLAGFVVIAHQALASQT